MLIYLFFSSVKRIISELPNKNSDFVLSRLKYVTVLTEGQNAIYFKGAAVARAYPIPSLRKVSDVDILLPTFEDGWKFLSVAENFYEFDRLKIYTYGWPDISGSIDLAPKDLEAYPRLDVKLRAFHIWGGMCISG